MCHKSYLLALTFSIALISFAADRVEAQGGADPAFARWLKPHDWKRDRDEPALSLGEKGCFDDQHIFAPHVVRMGDEYWMYYCGSQRCVDAGTYKGVAKDPSEAVRWFRSAADAGHPIAQYQLGVMYATGNGVVKDPAEAVRWYREAADRDNADAQNDLAVMYDAGEGVPEDDAQAVRWYRRAAAAGNASAQYNLGLMYANGEGVARDRTRAYVWLSMAAITSGGTTDRSALERVAATLAAPARKAADRLVATCRETASAKCGEPALP